MFTKLVALLFGLTCTWGGFEFYHKMRLEDFMSGPAIGYGLCSVALVFLGGFIAGVAREIK